MDFHVNSIADFKGTHALAVSTIIVFSIRYVDEKVRRRHDCEAWIRTLDGFLTNLPDQPYHVLPKIWNITSECEVPGCYHLITGIVSGTISSRYDSGLPDVR